MKAILKINDKEMEVEVSEEQIEKLTAEKKESPFERVALENCYYFITAQSAIQKSFEDDSEIDDIRYSVANYCTDYALIQQQAYRETLNRLLWRWQYENDESVCWGNYACRKWYIVRSVETENIFSSYNTSCQKLNTIYFSSEDKAEQAIKEVVMPFMAEHPDFVW
jgi:hypothetical protein